MTSEIWGERMRLTAGAMAQGRSLGDDDFFRPETCRDTVKSPGQQDLRNVCSQLHMAETERARRGLAVCIRFSQV